jgi:hypothetical protein
MGWKATVTKASWGEGMGEYAVIWEIPSVEQREKYFADIGVLSEEGKRLLEPDFTRMSSKYATLAVVKSATHYVEVEA